MVFPHTTPDGRLVNLYGRAVGTAEQVPKAKRHDHLPGAKGYFNAAALQAGAGPLWVCEGAFDALALLAAGVSRVWWRSLACRAGAGTGCGRCASWSSPSTPMPPGSSSGASSPARRRCGGSRWRCCQPAAYGGYKDVSEAWAAGVLAVGAGPAAAAAEERCLAVPQHLRESWAERVAIMVIDGGLPRAEAERLAWAGLQAPGAAP